MSDMTKEEYLEIRNDESKDTSPLYYLLWKLEGRQSLTASKFFELFWTWVAKVVGVHNMPTFQYNLFLKLDKHFEVSH